MHCSVRGCPGELEAQEVVHTVRHRGEVVVIDRVPAEVCGVCGDVLLSPETVRAVEKLLEQRQQPARSAPLYDFPMTA